MTNKSKSIKRSEFQEQYRSLMLNFRRIESCVVGIINTSLDDAEVEHLPIQARIKTEASAWQKYQAKNYSNPFELMTDLVGFRIVVFLESDIDRAKTALEEVFFVDPKNSVDKRKPAKIDTVGYRSLHLICSLGRKRAALREYSGIAERRFEIQIRTVLQHAWAEIEHKRNYKGQHVLPAELQHRLMILAGSLELIDREFSQIAGEAIAYRDKLIADSSSKRDDELSDIAIDAILSKKFADLGMKPPSLVNSDAPASQIQELSDFGVKTIGEFEELIENTKLDTIARSYDGKKDSYSIGLIRDLMISNDIEKYFERAHQGRWSGTTFEDVLFMTEATGRNDIESIMRAHGIELFHED